MPVIAVTLSLNIFNDIKTLVDQGLYSGPDAFLEIAAFNQLALERGVTPAELLSQGHRGGSSKSRAEAGNNSAADPPVSTRVSHHKPLPKPVAKRKPGTVSLTAGEIAQTMDRLARPKLAGSWPTTCAAASRPNDERLWGQVNRLFPLKLACRWIAIANIGLNDWLTLDKISDRLADDAATLGSHLEKLDGLARRKRDDALSTGLPRRSNIASRDRFLSQFVARTTRAGDIYPGAICQYALVSFRADHIVLTDDGLHLAQLPNPILDGLERGPRTSLSSEERDFFLQQVTKYVPGELGDFRVVLKAVNEGNVTPESLLSSTRLHFPSAWSAMMLRTHVSGVVARLTEVGAMERKWEGRNVNYKITALANSLRS